MTQNKRLTLSVPREASGSRLDLWLATIEEIQTRNQAARLIEKNKVQISGVLPLKVKASYRLRGGETVEIEIPPPMTSLITPEDIPLEILFQDSDLAFINKPAGLVTHPAAGHAQGTLINALMFHIKDLSDIGGVERPGLVHRLDKNTSGVMVVAKNNKTHQRLSDKFKAHEVHRQYWALVAGIPKKSELRIETQLARHPKHRKAFSSQPTGKRAVTHYKVIETFKNQAALLQVELETGRTHQIRVHLSELGHPVLGDALYGVKRQTSLITNNVLKKAVGALTRHALHAAELGFEHPRTNERLDQKTDWPEDLASLVQILKNL